MNKILLVDDERNVHYSLQRALGEAFRIISAFSGEEALQRLSSEKPQPRSSWLLSADADEIALVEFVPR